MDSLINAVSSLVKGVHGFFQARAVKKEKKVALEEKKAPVSDDYRMYKFGCWLCSAMTKFKCKPSTKQRHYVVECKMCGMDNKVKVNAELTNTK